MKKTLVALVLSGCAHGDLVYEKSTGDYVQQLHVYGAKTETVQKGAVVEKKFDLDHDGKWDWITASRYVDGKKVEEKHIVDGKLTAVYRFHDGKEYEVKNGI